MQKRNVAWLPGHLRQLKLSLVMLVYPPVQEDVSTVQISSANAVCIAASVIPRASHNELLFMEDVASNELQMPAILRYSDNMEAVMTMDDRTVHNNMQHVLQA